MRFVPIKSAEQLDLQALHQICSKLVGHRIAVFNQLRGFLLECGVIRGLQTFRRLHACPYCFRRELSPGGSRTHWKSAAFHGAHPERSFAEFARQVDQLFSFNKLRKIHKRPVGRPTVLEQRQTEGVGVERRK